MNVEIKDVQRWIDRLHDFAGRDEVKMSVTHPLTVRVYIYIYIIIIIIFIIIIMIIIII